MINLRLVENLGLEGQIIPSNMRLRSFTGNTIKHKGELNLTIKLAGINVYGRFIVSEQLDNDFLLGRPEMKKYNLELKMGKGTLESPKKIIKFINTPKDIIRSYEIKCKKTVVIPKDSVKYIWGKLPPKIKHNVQGVAEPRHDLANEKSIFIGTAAVYGINGQVPLICVNVSENDVTLTKGTLLAYIKPMDFGKRVEKIDICEDHNGCGEIKINPPSTGAGGHRITKNPRVKTVNSARGGVSQNHSNKFSGGLTMTHAKIASQIARMTRPARVCGPKKSSLLNLDWTTSTSS